MKRRAIRTARDPCFATWREQSGSVGPPVCDGARTSCFVKGGLSDHPPEAHKARPRGLALAIARAVKGGRLLPASATRHARRPDPREWGSAGRAAETLLVLRARGGSPRRRSLLLGGLAACWNRRLLAPKRLRQARDVANRWRPSRTCLRRHILTCRLVHGSIEAWDRFTGSPRVLGFRLRLRSRSRG